MKIWSYDEGWKKYEPGVSKSSDSTLHTFRPTRGYWFLLNAPAQLSLKTKAPLFGISIPYRGWALLSFNQAQEVDLSTKILSKEYFSSSHSPQNIKKIWEFDGHWKSFSFVNPALTTIRPGFAYWFLAGDHNQQTIPPALSITPEGAIPARIPAPVVPRSIVMNTPLTSPNFSLRTLKREFRTLSLPELNSPPEVPQ